VQSAAEQSLTTLVELNSISHTACTLLFQEPVFREALDPSLCSNRTAWKFAVSLHRDMPFRATRAEHLPLKLCVMLDLYCLDCGCA
jgi:hypothetical protein